MRDEPLLCPLCGKKPRAELTTGFFRVNCDNSHCSSDFIAEHRFATIAINRWNRYVVELQGEEATP